MTGTPAAPATPPGASSTGATPAVAPAKPAALPPGPPAAPRPPAPPKPPRGGGGLVVLSLFAVLVALGSSAVSVYALDQARRASSSANEARSIADRAAPTTAPAAAPVTTPPRPAATVTATPSKGPSFIAELVRAELKVQSPPSKCASVYVDIDKMTVGDLAGHEFYLSNCVGPLSVHVDRTSGAVPTPNNPTAEVCAAQITADTASAELVLPVVNGLTFCLLTNRSDATQQGIPQRIAIVEVRDVGADNSVTLAVSTYRVPGTA